MLYDSLPPTLTTKSINDIVKGDIIHMMRLMDTELELFILMRDLVEVLVFSLR